MDKIKITDEVADFCIENKLTIEQGLIKLIDNKFISLDEEIAALKAGMVSLLNDNAHERY